MGGERDQGILVARGEDADSLVENFEGADDLVAVIAERDGEDIAGAVAGLAVDPGVEARVAVRVADIDGFTGRDGAAGDSDARIETQDFVAAEGDFGPEFIAL